MCRKIAGVPVVTNFIPSSEIPDDMPVITLTIEEFEAVRLGDWLGLYHDECARQMGISRQTFGNIITIARQKIAGAIVNGRPITIDTPEFGCHRDGGVCSKCAKSGKPCCKNNSDSNNQTCCGKRQKRCCKKMVEENRGELHNEDMHTS